MIFIYIVFVTDSPPLTVGPQKNNYWKEFIYEFQTIIENYIIFVRIHGFTIISKYFHTFWVNIIDWLSSKLCNTCPLVK